MKNMIKKCYYALACLALAIPAAAFADDIKITNPLSATPDIPSLAAIVIKAVVGASGVFALIAFIYGGVLYTLSGVDANNVKKAKEMMINAVIGLIIIFSSYAILNYLMGTILGVK